MDNPPCIYIILPTYNGELYLEEQINSIIAQSYNNWRLIIRDDGASDETLTIIEKFCNLDQRIQLINDEFSNIGVIKNFALLLDYALKSKADYVACCDQDDIWQSNKLSLQFESMSRQEKQSLNLPILVFSDLRVVNHDLELINPTFMNYQGIRTPHQVSLNHLLFQNIVVGNTILINSQLLKIICPLPLEIHMHDWWIGLCAATFGKINFLPEKTVDYRLHGNNQVGASDVRSIYSLINLAWWNKIKKMNNVFVKSFIQAKYLQVLLLNRIKRGDSEEEGEKLEIINRHLNLLSVNFISRCFLFIKTKEKCKTRVTCILFMLQLLMPKLVKKARLKIKTLTF